jgi:protein-disulfide isomerase
LKWGYGMDEVARGKAKWRSILETLTLLAMISASGVLSWAALHNSGGREGGKRPSLSVPSKPVSIAGAPVMGNAAAQLVLVEFSDFQCPFCGRFARETLADIERDFVKTGQVRVAFRNLPLAIHSFAEPAAKAALCADRQAQFWPMHDRLFQTPPKLDDISVREHARALGLDLDRFDACVHSDDARERVEADAALAKSLGVLGTPSFLVGVPVSGDTIKGVEWIGGSLPYDEFKKVLVKSLRNVRT